jgi:RNA polymerase sigma-70 factor (ECF subfamily)
VSSRLSELPNEGFAGMSNEELGWLVGHHSNESVQREAFDELFRRLWRASVEWARSAGGGNQVQAEDASTQAWLRAWRYRHRYDPDRARYGTWMGTIVKNETLDLLKAEGRHTVLTSAATDLDQIDRHAPEEPNLFALSYVWEAFNELRKAKPEFAAVLSLKAQGYKDKQISAKLGIGKIGTVASRLFRAKKFIAEWLVERGVVYLPENTIGCVHPWGLNPLCRTTAGCFYDFSPLDGLFVLPTGEAPPPGASLVCGGFFVRVWTYPLQRFRVVTSDRDLPEPNLVIFRWNQYLVIALQGETAPIVLP